MNVTVAQWAQRLATTLEIGTETALEPEIVELLDLTREVAHNVARPAGPISTYYVGLAVGLSGGDNNKAREIIAAIRELVPAPTSESR